jgi:hypothetical protein
MEGTMTQAPCKFHVGQKVTRKAYTSHDGKLIPAIHGMTVTEIEYHPPTPAGFRDEPVMAPAYYSIHATAPDHAERLMERYFIAE